jgi:hypothetical protein
MHAAREKRKASMNLTVTWANSPDSCLVMNAVQYEALQENRAGPAGEQRHIWERRINLQSCGVDVAFCGQP